MYLVKMITFCSSLYKEYTVNTVVDVLDVIRSADTTRPVALELRKALLNLDFQLHNKFCDANELESTIISDTLITILAALLNLKKISHLKNYHDRELQIEENDEGNIVP